MNVSLTPRLTKYVREKVKNGLYGSASEVVREALRLMEQRERDKEAHLAALHAQLATGKARPGGRELPDPVDLFDELKESVTRPDD